MYNLQRPPSKLASKANRRGPTQPIDKFEFGRDSGGREPPGPPDMSSPRPVFNGKKQSSYNRSNSGGSSTMREPLSQYHEENVTFVNSEWDRVWREYVRSKDNQLEGGPEFYFDKDPVRNIDERGDKIVRKTF